MDKLLPTILIIAIILSGCIDKEAVTTDIYRCTVDDGVLYLSSDEQYEMLIDDVYGGGGIYGNYSIREGQVLLKRSLLGDIIHFTINGSDLIDPDGDQWVRD